MKEKIQKKKLNEVKTKDAITIRQTKRSEEISNVILQRQTVENIQFKFLKKQEFNKYLEDKFISKIVSFFNDGALDDYHPFLVFLISYDTASDLYEEFIYTVEPIIKFNLENKDLFLPLKEMMLMDYANIADSQDNLTPTHNFLINVYLFEEIDEDEDEDEDDDEDDDVDE